jgi:copper chaperone CopZ
MVENELERASMQVLGMKCEGCVETVKTALTGVQGLENLDVEIGRVSFDYYPAATSLESVTQMIETLGYRVPLLKPSRNPFTRFLSRMIENNEKTFGHERLDCCTMKKK